MPTLDQVTILNVDDDEAGRYTTNRILRRAGFKINEASTGQEALSKVKENPDLVILDVNLPDINGFEVCRKIKADDTTRHIPVLNLSATYQDNQSRVDGLESGADAYLTQPVEPMVLIATIKALLRMRQMEIEAMNASRQWQTTFDAITDSVCLLDQEGKMKQCNRAMINLLEKPIHEILGRTCRELLNCKKDDNDESCFQRIRETGQREIMDLPFGDRWIHLTIDPIMDHFDRFIGGVQILSDITEKRHVEEELNRYRRHLEELVEKRTIELTEANESLKIEIMQHKRTAAALMESEEKYSTLVEQARDGVVIVQDGVYKFANRAASRMGGYSLEEIAGRPMLDMVAPEFREIIAQKYTLLMTGGEVPLTYELKILTREKTTRDVEISAAMIQYQRKPAIMAIVRDITERKRLEEELQKVERLESIGVLAGGIAHDFNNILTAVIGNLSLAKLFVNPGDKAFSLLSQTEKASYQAKGLTQQLLTFARGGAPIKKAASISELLESTANFTLRGSKVKCNFSLPPDLYPVEIDPEQISQVINNLVINARQAMPDGGVITISAENRVIGAHNGVPLDQGKYIKIAIKDQGIGIPKKHLQRIFDPYFTTKQEGSGLGLAICYSIIKRHGGYIDVESQVGVGTTFFIYLPASLEEIAVQEEEEKIYRGEGRVLFMDDEEMVRNIGRALLEELGYEVELVASGEEAITLYRQAMSSGHPFRVVIMDLTIPGGMGGREAIPKLLSIDPKAKAIVSSGYSNDPVMAGFKEYGFSGMVSKPYKIEELSQVLHMVIGGAEYLRRR